MRKTFWLLIGIGFVFVIGTAGASADRVRARQDVQMHKIRQGVHSGNLTRGEARALIREQHRIEHARLRAASDGRLTPGERQRLHFRQSIAGDHIHRLKHNGMGMR